MNKRILSLLVSILFIFTASFLVVAEDDLLLSSDRNFAYTIKDDNCIDIYGYIGTEKEVIIPSEIDGFLVHTVNFNPLNYFSADGGTAYQSKDAKKLVLSDGIKELVLMHSSVKEIVLPSTLTSLVVEVNLNIEKIEIPEGVERLRLYYCGKIKEVSLPNSITSLNDLALTTPSLESVYIPPSVKSIVENAFDENVFDENSNFVIEGYENSYAHEFALRHSITFESTGAFGDCNGDNKVNGKDILALRRHNANIEPIYDEFLADCNSDGIINQKDTLALRRYYANITAAL